MYILYIFVDLPPHKGMKGSPKRENREIEEKIFLSIL
jgi:hypothetical protein